MSALQVSIDQKAGTMTITLPLLREPQPSGTGKTMIVATTGGNAKTDIQVNGRPLSIGVNAYYKPA